MFPHYMEEGRRWHNGTATRWWNTEFSLKTIEFLKTVLYVPENLVMIKRYCDSLNQIGEGTWVKNIKDQTT
ncbi:MAG: hypothetical protein PF637_11755 [Spirochaetes bacterium]|jgi:hypothetical protein|nr:hypothetical protein [Spirochaetota bacterium]